jgi:hypothetical protein
MNVRTRVRVSACALRELLGCFLRFVRLMRSRHAPAPTRATVDAYAAPASTRFHSPELNDVAMSLTEGAECSAACWCASAGKEAL